MRLKKSVRYRRNLIIYIISVEKERVYRFNRGTTAWTSERIRKLVVDEQVTHISEGAPVAASGEADAMDTS